MLRRGCSGGGSGEENPVSGFAHPQIAAKPGAVQSARPMRTGRPAAPGRDSAESGSRRRSSASRSKFGFSPLLQLSRATVWCPSARHSQRPQTHLPKNKTGQSPCNTRIILGLICCVLGFPIKTKMWSLAWRATTSARQPGGRVGLRAAHTRRGSAQRRVRGRRARARALTSG